jgi:hypothetical protein
MTLTSSPCHSNDSLPHSFSEQWKDFVDYPEYNTLVRYYHKNVNCGTKLIPLELSALIAEYAADGYHVGEQVDVLHQQIWTFGTVTAIGLGKIQVNVFCTVWSINEWIPTNTGRIAPLFTHSAAIALENEKRDAETDTKRLPCDQQIQKLMIKTGASKEIIHEAFSRCSSWSDCVHLCLLLLKRPEFRKKNYQLARPASVDSLDSFRFYDEVLSKDPHLQ